jgi:fibronectin-binding autotransporter adhesin
MWAAYNGTYGWFLDNHNAATPQPVTLSSPNTNWAFDFTNNGSYGLWVQSLGNITLTGLDASNNGSFGATLDNAWSGATGTITVTTLVGSNSFIGNAGDGLDVYSNRAITINNLYAVWNGSYGARLDNSYSGNSLPQNVTISGWGTFNNNGDDGLDVSTYGAITLYNITANNNGQNVDPNTGWGAYLDNYQGGAGVANPITLYGTNTFNNNYQDGLWATSLGGAITAGTLTANSNGGRGAYLDNQWDPTIGMGGITLTGTNTFNSNGGFGLELYSFGNATISNITASSNGSSGAYLDVWRPTGTASITLSGTNTFSFNGDYVANTGTGLEAYANGSITINNLTANWNADSGAYLNNCRWNGSVCTGSGNITLTGTNTFLKNYNDGLYTDSHGNITMNKVTADNNGGRGVYGGADGNITVACGSMTNNGWYGWWFQSWLTVTLKGVFAYGNNGGLGNTNPANGTFVYVRACP